MLNPFAEEYFLIMEKGQAKEKECEQNLEYKRSIVVVDTKNHHNGSKQKYNSPSTTLTGQIVDETTIKDPQIKKLQVQPNIAKKRSDQIGSIYQQVDQ